MDCVPFTEARAYCRWMGKRLPTIDEWLLAASGNDDRLYPWGNDKPTCEHLVVGQLYGEPCGPTSSQPVGSRPKGASPYGVLDMAGNVREWIGFGEAEKPGPIPRILRRGGAWSDAKSWKFRVKATDDELGTLDTGFRCVSITRPLPPNPTIVLPKGTRIFERTTASPPRYDSYQWSVRQKIVPNNPERYDAVHDVTVPGLQASGPVSVVGFTSRANKSHPRARLGILNEGRFTPTEVQAIPASGPNPESYINFDQQALVDPRGRRVGLATRWRIKAGRQVQEQRYLSDCPLHIPAGVAPATFDKHCSAVAVDPMSWQWPVLQGNYIAFLNGKTETSDLIVAQLQPRLQIVGTRTIKIPALRIVRSPITDRALVLRANPGGLQPVDLKHPETAYPWVDLPAKASISILPDGRALAAVHQSDQKIALRRLTDALQFAPLEARGLKACTSDGYATLTWDAASSQLVGPREHNGAWDALRLVTHGERWCFLSAWGQKIRTVPRSADRRQLTVDGRGQPFVVDTERASLRVRTVTRGDDWTAIGRLSTPASEQLRRAKVYASPRGERLVVIAETRASDGTSQWYAWVADGARR